MNEIEKLKAELQRFKDMAKKGLGEFKDVGGCWGCGLQLQLNQDMEDIKRLKAENENLKRKLRDLTLLIEVITKENFKYKEAFKEIKHIFKIHEEELYETLHTPVDEMVLKIIDEVLE